MLVINISSVEVHRRSTRQVVEESLIESINDEVMTVMTVMTMMMVMRSRSIKLVAT